MTPARLITLRVDERVLKTLGRFAAEANMRTEFYAQLIFEAAYAARCGVQPDEAIEDALSRLTAGAARPAAHAPAAPASQPNVDHARIQSERDAAVAQAARLPEIERERDDARREAATARRDLERLTISEAALCLRAETAEHDLEALRAAPPVNLEDLAAATAELRAAIAELSRLREVLPAAAKRGRPRAEKFVWGGTWGRS